ncbi:FadR/GntR family transcriptional regulator [Arthrobacter mobilis]|uniref:FadR family transcriptional regulator n=1 Tax=Arthrobacter mobilis TaxID=2724944 RepID=A0A7X6K4K1_9MICC|nr:GntR family transcriptional regulator [Arthrobacter mobilis]NKX55417.1 FadR family transcriptional regulator [Arthrobacter mobilis]
MEQDSLQTLARRVLFAPLDEISRTETVIDRLRSAITLGVLADGEQLPSEVDLAKQFNVSPVTLRDALKVLRGEGLVRTTRGRQGGSFVSDIGESTQRHLEEMLLELPPLEIRDLTDWQCAISSRAAALAAERSSKHSVQVLTHLVDKLAEADTPRAFRRAESRFFIELAAASQSTRLSKAAIRLQVQFAPIKTLAYRSESVRAQAQEHLRRIARSVSAGDGLDAHIDAVQIHTLVGEELLKIRRILDIQRAEAEDEPR